MGSDSQGEYVLGAGSPSLRVQGDGVGGLPAGCYTQLDSLPEPTSMSLFGPTSRKPPTSRTLANPQRPNGIYVIRFRSSKAGPRDKRFLRGYGFQGGGDSGMALTVRSTDYLLGEMKRGSL
jgi:hypothetical protein